MSSGKEIDHQISSLHLVGGIDVNEQRPSQTQKSVDLKVNGGTIIKKSLVVLGNVYTDTIQEKNPTEGIIINGNVFVNGIISSIYSSSLLESIVDITSTQVATLTDTVGYAITPAPEIGEYIIIYSMILEYHIGNASWAIDSPGFLAISETPSFIGYMGYSYEDLVGPSDIVSVAVFDKYENTVSIPIRSALYLTTDKTTLLYPSATGTTFIRVRTSYRRVTF